jgi:hypothetical protein
MRRHRFGNLSFELPAAWTDRTMVLYAAPVAGGAKISMMRLPRDTAGSLHAHLTRWADDLARTLDRLEVSDPVPLRVGGRDALRLLMRWTNDDRPMIGGAVHVDLPESSEVLTVGCMANAMNEAACVAELERLVASCAFSIEASISAPPVAEACFPFVPMPGRRRTEP